MATGRCHLCFDTSDELTNIFINGDVHNGIEQIVLQFFNFAFEENVCTLTQLCGKCWTAIEGFHQYCQKIRNIHQCLIEKNEIVFITADDDPCGAEIAGKISENLKVDANESDEYENFIEMIDENLAGIEDDENSFDVHISATPFQKQNVPSKNVSKTKKKSCENMNETPMYKQYGKLELTPEVVALLEEQMQAESKFQPEIVDCERIRKFMKMECNLCGEPFNTFVESQEHYLNKHKRAAFWTCCRIQLDNDYEVIDHMKYHDDINVFKCAACHKCFLTSKKLKYHIRRLHLQTDDALQCSICQRSFGNQRLLLAHQKRHIRMNCPHCKKMISIANYESHVRVAHIKKTYAKKIVCDICGKISCDPQTHKRHYLVEHSGIDQRLKCDICGQWVKHKKQMHKHMRKHFDTPQTCKLCGKITPNRYALSTHLYQHKKGKHVCTFCGKTFIKKNVWMEHESTHTGRTGLYQCDFCDRTFRFNSGMYSHRKQAHPEEHQALVNRDQ